VQVSKSVREWSVSEPISPDTFSNFKYTFMVRNKAIHGWGSWPQPSVTTNGYV
jgi:hypothetical protein